MIEHVTTDRPILLVDIDGVLNPWGIETCPEGFQEYELFSDHDEPMRLAAFHGEWLRELSAVFDLAWASAWGSQAHKLLGPILGLEEFPFVPMLPMPFPPEDKVAAVAEFVRDQAAAWIDDMLVEAAFRWATSRRVPTLLLAIDHTAGLTRPTVDQLLTWAAQLS
jgi:hypothetical protein